MAKKPHWNVPITESHLGILVQLVETDLQKPVVAKTNAKDRHEEILKKLKDLQDLKTSVNFSHGEFGLFGTYISTGKLSDEYLVSLISDALHTVSTDGTIGLMLV